MFFALIAGHFGIDVHGNFPAVLGQAEALLGRARVAPVRKTRQKKDAPVDDLGPASAKWDYLDAAGALIAVVYRHDPPGRKKEFRPWDVKRRKMAPPDPRPLYNQPGLIAASLVVLVEGEKCAKALIDIGVAATTAMHGANAPVDETDWSPLAGKAVLIWPDKDKPGWDYADRASQAVLAAGATRCHILYPPTDRPRAGMPPTPWSRGSMSPISSPTGRAWRCTRHRMTSMRSRTARPKSTTTARRPSGAPMTPWR